MMRQIKGIGDYAPGDTGTCTILNYKLGLRNTRPNVILLLVQR